MAVEPLYNRITAIAMKRGTSAQIDVVLCSEAFEQLKRGNIHEHDRLVMLVAAYPDILCTNTTEVCYYY